jgi:hypothetical protein
MANRLCLVLLVAVAGVAASIGAARLADAVMNGDKAAVRALLQEKSQQKIDVNAAQPRRDHRAALGGSSG